MHRTRRWEEGLFRPLAARAVFVWQRCLHAGKAATHATAQAGMMLTAGAHLQSLLSHVGGRGVASGTDKLGQRIRGR